MEKLTKGQVVFKLKRQIEILQTTLRLIEGEEPTEKWAVLVCLDGTAISQRYFGPTFGEKIRTDEGKLFFLWRKVNEIVSIYVEEK